MPLAWLLGLTCALASRVDSLWSLYLVTGVLVAAGVAAVSWVPTGALIARWFTERRGSVMGLAFSGMGAGVLAVGPLAQWLIAAPKPLGIFCPTDIYAYFVHQAARHCGLDLLRDLHLIGVDNQVDYCEAVYPPFSSVDQGMIGYRAAETLERMMNGLAVPHVIRVQPRGVVERSVDSGAAHMPLTGRSPLGSSGTTTWACAAASMCGWLDPYSRAASPGRHSSLGRSMRACC